MTNATHTNTANIATIARQIVETHTGRLLGHVVAAHHDLVLATAVDYIVTEVAGTGHDPADISPHILTLSTHMRVARTLATEEDIDTITSQPGWGSQGAGEAEVDLISVLMEAHLYSDGQIDTDLVSELVNA